MSDFGGRWRKAVHGVKEQFQMPGPNMFLGQEPVLIRYSRSRLPADVVLSPDAQQTLAPTWNQPPPDFSEIFVRLATVEGSDGRHIEIYINEHRLGALTAADSADFLAILDTADGRPVIGQAIRDRDSNDSWALHVYRPEPS
jgi:hypothetical protein